MDFFDGRTIFYEEKIPEFVALHDDFVSRNRKGFGYWICKPYIVRRILEGNTFLSCDSGCHFNISGSSLKRLGKYLEVLDASEHSTSPFELAHKEQT